MAGQNINRLFYTQDRVSRRRFLVNTGAEVSVLPATRADKYSNQLGAKLTAANGSRISTFGNCKISLPLMDLYSHRCLSAVTWSRFPQGALASCGCVLRHVPGHYYFIGSHRGPQFTSKLWTTVSKLLGINLHHTTAYYPQSNGLVERFHRHLKSGFRARFKGTNWLDALPWVLLGIRTVPKHDLGCSSGELVFGAPITVPGDFIATSSSTPTPTCILPWLQGTVSKFLPIPTSSHIEAFCVS